MKCLLTFLFVLLMQVSFSQDTSKMVPPFPKRAAIMSAIIPGSGQIYNHFYSTNKKWKVYLKVPLIYTSLYFAVSSLTHKINLEKELRSEYNKRISTGVVSSKWQAYDNYNLVLLEKSASKSRNTLYFLAGGIYLIQILEASIDAHFSHFDISPDLSLNIQPYHSNFNQTGLTFTLNIK